MIKTKPITVQMDNKNTSSDKPHQIEDAIHKTMMQFFSNELLPYFHIEGEVDHIGPSEIVHLEIKKLYEDFNLVMKDGSWIHFEFQSTDNGIQDLKRFRTYEALTSQQYNVIVRTYVLYSGSIKNPITEFSEGFNTYRVQPIIMKGYRTEEVFENIYHKLENSIPLTKDDLIPLTLCPLMSGNMPQKDRIRKALHIIQQSEDIVQDADKIEAVIYAMASKFLNETERNQIREEIKMTELGALIYNDGIADGIEQATLDNAKNFFLNGVSFEIVRKSIKNISDEKLHEIYDEVMASKNKEV